MKDDTPGIDLAKVRYYLRLHEIFARSYAQYIAEKSGDDVLMRQLGKLIQEQLDGVVKYT